MQVPSYYDASRVGKLFAPDVKRIIEEGNKVNVNPATNDSRKVALILVDAQIDFVHTDGALSVPGAVEDTKRTIDWLYRNVAQVSQIIASLDTHVPDQIFYPPWWINQKGEHPLAFTAITSDEVKSGIWMPTTEFEWSVEYVKLLEDQGKKTLIIWPYHTMLGTPGHSITPALYEAIAYHSAARSVDPIFLSKGSIPKTEHYSILEPEVKVPSEPLGTLNLQLIELLKGFDLIYVAGQAKSHCVLETITSLYNYFADANPMFIKQWRFLKDCTSSVVHPEIDFEAIANKRLAEFETMGMKMVTSLDEID